MALLPVEILSLSGMYEEYDLSLFGEPHFVDLKGTEGTRLYVDSEGERAIREKTDGRFKLHLIDTGDYHYITRLFISDIGTPFDLLVFDNHSDDQEPEFQGLRSCGSWIRDSIEDLEKTLMSVKLVRGNGETAFLKGSSHPERPLYVSIDKDALKREVCPCNWDQGELTLPGLSEILSREIRGRKLLGADICGGVPPSPPFSSADIRLNQDADRLLLDVISSEGDLIS